MPFDVLDIICHSTYLILYVIQLTWYYMPFDVLDIICYFTYLILYTIVVAYQWCEYVALLSIVEPEDANRRLGSCPPNKYQWYVNGGESVLRDLSEDESAIGSWESNRSQWRRSKHWVQVMSMKSKSGSKVRTKNVRRRYHLSQCFVIKELVAVKHQN